MPGKKYLAILVFAFIFVTILMPQQEIYAEQEFSVYIWQEIDEQPFPVENLIVNMKFYVDEVWTQWLLADEDGDGWYSYTVEDVDGWVDWRTWYTPEDQDPISPNTNPTTGTTTTSFEWEIDPGNW